RNPLIIFPADTKGAVNDAIKEASSVGLFFLWRFAGGEVAVLDVDRFGVVDFLGVDLLVAEAGFFATVPFLAGVFTDFDVVVFAAGFGDVLAGFLGVVAFFGVVVDLAFGGFLGDVFDASLSMLLRFRAEALFVGVLDDRFSSSSPCLG
ncbi:MAG: hypothetical protein SGARI_006937, partial [Bacillariaceae sp.]